METANPQAIGVISPGAEAEYQPSAQIVHMLLRLVLAVRYRKNVVIGSMLICAVLGGLYYVTATRYYSAKAAMLITQVGPDSLDVSITAEDSVRRNTMPTFENMIRSPKVLEGALETLPQEDRIDLANVPRERWVETMQRKVYAKALRNTNILELAYTSRDPRVAVAVVNAIVQSYLEFIDKVHKGTAGDVTEMLVKERNELTEEFNRKQQELLNLRRRYGDLGFRTDSRVLHPSVQRAVTFNDALTAAQKDRIELEAAFARLETALRSGGDFAGLLMAVADQVGRDLVMNSLGLGGRELSAASDMEQNLLRDRAELAVAQRHFGPAHPDVLALNERVRLAEQFLNGTQQRLNQRLADLRQGEMGSWLTHLVQQRIGDLREKEAVLRQAFEQAQAQAVDLCDDIAQIEILEHDTKRLSDMNDSLLTQIASLKLKQNGMEIRTAVTEEPTIDEEPVSPRLPYVVLGVLVGGFGIGLAAVHLLDTLDDRFRSPDELQQRLGCPVLTMIQKLQDQNAAGLDALPMYSDPTAAENEAFRTLRTALALAHPDARQIVITSAEPGDGKTTVLANLAVGYAQSDKKTLLIDADLRRPGLTRLMNLRGTYGLSEVLRSEGDLGRMAAAQIQASGMNGLDVLPSGPRPSNPAELLANPRFSQLLAWASAIYDQVLIDSPPALVTSDTAVIGRLVDGVILVVQPAKNRRRLVTRVVESLGLLKLPLLGVVVNRANSGDDHGYYGYRGGYSYGYGYGYGPGHAYGYGSDEESGAEQTADGSAGRAGRGHEEEPETRVIPRKVA